MVGFICGKIDPVNLSSYLAKGQKGGQDTPHPPCVELNLRRHSSYSVRKVQGKKYKDLPVNFPFQYKLRTLNTD